MEISPGSIRTHECEHCGNEAYTFDAVALSTEGVELAKLPDYPTLEEDEE